MTPGGGGWERRGAGIRGSRTAADGGRCGAGVPGAGGGGSADPAGRASVLSSGRALDLDTGTITSVVSPSSSTRKLYLSTEHSGAWKGAVSW